MSESGSHNYDVPYPDDLVEEHMLIPDEGEREELGDESNFEPTETGSGQAS